MRSLIILFLTSLIAATAIAQEAKFSVDNSTHKWPKTAEGPTLVHYFVVTNEGDAPLIISDYKVACSCTKAFLPEKPILPGESYKLKVTFDTKGKAYFQDRTIYLTTNTKSKEEKIRIKVMIK